MKTVGTAVLTLLLSLAFWAPSALGAPGPASQPDLSAEQRRLVDDLLASQHPYDCCGDTIVSCLERSQPCPLALRLERAIRRMVTAGMSRAEIEDALAIRKQSMASRQAVRIASDRRFEAGTSAAPVVLSIYASGRSTGCAHLIPALQPEVSSGRLKGKVRLNYRPLVSGSDETDEAWGRAMVAAADEGLFWPYLFKLYDEREALNPSLIQKWAQTSGVDICAFDIAYRSPDTGSLLAAVRREALENGVETVPAAFINGRRIHCGLTVETLVDLLDEEYERVTTDHLPGAP